MLATMLLSLHVVSLSKTAIHGILWGHNLKGIPEARIKSATSSSAKCYTTVMLIVVRPSMFS